MLQFVTAHVAHEMLELKNAHFYNTALLFEGLSPSRTSDHRLHDCSLDLSRISCDSHDVETSSDEVILLEPPIIVGKVRCYLNHYMQVMLLK